MTEPAEEIQMILKKQQYCQNMKLNVSLFKKPSMSGDKHICNVQTETFHVENLASLKLEFEDWGDRIMPIVSMKKHSNARNSIVRIDISYKIYFSNTEFSEQYYCSETWVNQNIGFFHFIKSLTVNGQKIFAYNVEFNIIVHEIMPTAMKLYEDEDFTDFQLHAEDGNVAVHKAMLSVHSDVFKAMLKGDWKENAEGHINMDGVTAKTLQHLKDYMYLGDLPDDGLETLLAVAGRYLMEKLKVDCVSKLIKTMKAENYASLVKLACQHNVPELVTALVFQTPDEVLNGICQLKIKEQED